MTEDKATELLHSLVMTDAFDELVVYRLEKSLQWTLDCLKGYDYDHNDLFDDLKYCRSLVVILQNFTLNDYEAETKILNTIQDKILSNYF